MKKTKKPHTPETTKPKDSKDSDLDMQYYFDISVSKCDLAIHINYELPQRQ